MTRCSENRNDIIVYSEETKEVSLFKAGLIFLEKRKANTERHFCMDTILRWLLIYIHLFFNNHYCTSYDSAYNTWRDINHWNYDISRTFPITTANPLKLFNNDNKKYKGGTRPKPQYACNSDDEMDSAAKVFTH